MNNFVDKKAVRWVIFCHKNTTTSIQNVYLHFYGISYNMDVISLDKAQVMITSVLFFTQQADLFRVSSITTINTIRYTDTQRVLFQWNLPPRDLEPPLKPRDHLAPLIPLGVRT
jgi:hypothetical protein